MTKRPASKLLASLLLLALKSQAHAVHSFSHKTIDGFGSGTDRGVSVAIDRFGFINVAADLDESFIGEGQNIWIAKFDSDFNLFVSTTISGFVFRDDFAGGIAADDFGNLYLTGSIRSEPGLGGDNLFIAILDFDLNLVHIRVCSPEDPCGSLGLGRDFGSGIATDGIDRIYLIGSMDQGSGNGGSDVWISRYNSALDRRFTSTFSGSAGLDDFGAAVALGPNGEVYALGTLQEGSQSGEANIWIGKYDSELILISSTAVNGLASSTDTAGAIAAGPDGSVYASGSVNDGAQSGGENGWIGKYDSSLNFLSSSTFNGSGNGQDRILGLAVDDEGKIHAAGFIDQGPGSGGQNLWFGKYDSFLNLLSSAVFNGSGNGSDSAQAVALDSSGKAFVTGFLDEGSSEGGVNIWISKHFPLAAPSNFSGKALGVSSIAWSWSDQQGESGYRVFSEGDLDLSGELAPGTTFWLETALSTNTAYARRLLAVDGLETSSTALKTVYTLAAKPEGLAALEIGISSITLQWESNTNLPGTQYQLDYWRASRSTSSLTVADTAAALSGLSEGTTFFIQVRSKNGDGILSEPSGPVSAITLSSPTAPSSLSIGSAGGSLSLETSRGQVLLQIPSGSFSETVTVTLQSKNFFPGASSPGTELFPSGAGIEVLLDRPVQPSKDVFLTLSYQDFDVLGLDENRLVLARFDSDSNLWVPLSSFPDPFNNKVTGKTNHLSLFQVMQAVPSGTFLNVKTFPNPLRPSLGHTSMTFSGLPANSSVRIYTLLGELVRELETGASGLASWDGNNRSGQKTASGVYIAHIRGGGGQKTVKIAVQR